MLGGKQTGFITPGISKYEPAVLPNRYHYVAWNDGISRFNNSAESVFPIFRLSSSTVYNDSVASSIWTTVNNLIVFYGKTNSIGDAYDISSPIFEIIYDIRNDISAVDSVSTLYNVEYLVNPIRFMEFYDIILDYMRKSSSVPNSLIPALVLPQSLAVYNPYLNIFANDNVYNQTQSEGFSILCDMYNVARQMFEDSISVITNGLGLILEQYNQH